MVVKCPKCGREVRNSKYCTRCGSKIEMPSEEDAGQERRSAVQGGDTANVASGHVTQNSGMHSDSELEDKPHVVACRLTFIQQITLVLSVVLCCVTVATVCISFFDSDSWGFMSNLGIHYWDEGDVLFTVLFVAFVMTLVTIAWHSVAFLLSGESARRYWINLAVEYGALTVVCLLLTLIDVALFANVDKWGSMDSLGLSLMAFDLSVWGSGQSHIQFSTETVAICVAGVMDVLIGVQVYLNRKSRVLHGQMS